MDKKLDYAKEMKELYLPGVKPVILNVGKIPFIMIDGQGDPNGEEFKTVMEALYAFSYTIKMSYKTQDVPEGYFEYRVFPLEGVWDLVDITKPFTDKSNYKYTVMIRQPAFVGEHFFEKTKEKLILKKDNPYISKAVFGTLEEGLCCQMMHMGSYDDEPASFAEMMKYCRENGYERTAKTHREIYLSDPRRTEASKLKTVLRFCIKKA